MTVLPTITLFLLILLPLIVSPYSIPHQPTQDDKMCRIQGSILCIKDDLMIIATIAKAIVRTSIAIESNLKQTMTVETFNRYVNNEMNFTRSNLPLPHFHDAFFRRSNIDKEHLSELLAEAHDALIYYYNTIDDLIKRESVFGGQTDQELREVQDNIRYEMICRYRSILYVYGREWKSAGEIGHMGFSQKHRLSPSVTHDVHSIVIVRYIRQWMEVINIVILNLDMGFFDQCST